MVEFWNHWWALLYFASLLFGLLWAFWVYISAPPVEKPGSSARLTAAELRWNRWCGWLAVVAGRGVRLRAISSGEWAALLQENEKSLSQAEKANRARFAIPMGLAWLTGIFGIAQGALSIICLAFAPLTPWLIVSVLLTAWAAVPSCVTAVVMWRWWARRRTFEWQFLQDAGRLVRACERANRRDGDIGKATDAIEETMVSRLARTPVDLPSYAARARRWQARSTPVLEARPPITSDDTRAVLAWVERCSEIIRSRWDRPRWTPRRTTTEITRRTDLPTGIHIRFGWSITVLFVNTILIAVGIVADGLPPRIHLLLEALKDPALINGVTLAALALQGAAFAARMITRRLTAPPTMG